jgi:hypothetical protein
MGGSGTHAVLLGVWEELRQAIGAWLDVRQRPQAQQNAALQVPPHQPAPVLHVSIR